MLLGISSLNYCNSQNKLGQLHILRVTNLQLDIKAGEYLELSVIAKTSASTSVFVLNSFFSQYSRIFFATIVDFIVNLKVSCAAT